MKIRWREGDFEFKGTVIREALAEPRQEWEEEHLVDVTHVRLAHSGPVAWYRVTPAIRDVGIDADRADPTR